MIIVGHFNAIAGTSQVAIVTKVGEERGEGSRALEFLHTSVE